MLEAVVALLLLGLLAVCVAYGRRRDDALLSADDAKEPAAAKTPDDTPNDTAAMRDNREGDGDSYFDGFASVERLLEQGNPSAALSRIEEMLAAYPHENHGQLLYSVSVCFDGLTEGFAPEAVIKAFDALSAGSPAFRAAVQAHGLDDFADALAASFVNLPEDISKRTLRDALAFVRQPHPLVVKTVSLYDESAAEHLNSLAKYVFDDWDEDGTPLAAVLKLLDARLA